MSKEVKQPEKTVGSFLKTEDEVCYENGKPLIYFFGSKSCPHCAWEHPVLEKVIKDFEGQISFHNNMDSSNDSEVFSKYSNGGIPTLVFGCKYYRLGSGEQAGEEKETKDLTAMLCKLTGSKAEVCKSVEDLIKEIK
jgi:thiol-disulfide isomerase/thioredoxin